MKFVEAKSVHRRHGEIENNFDYGMNMLYVPVHAPVAVPPKINRFLLSYNRRFSLLSVRDKDHGFLDQPVLTLNAFARSILEAQGLTETCDGQIWLLTQPRIFGYVFNPVSFWYFFDKTGALRAVLAEVNNTAGQRHFYVCRHEGGGEIRKSDHLISKKIFYVSPFQNVAGEYEFRFHVADTHIGTWIDYTDGPDGVFAALTGKFSPLQNRSLIRSAISQPLGALKIIALIYWQALKLKLKGAQFRDVPEQDTLKVSSTE